MNKFQRIAPGLYRNDVWTIQRSGRMDAYFWFAYRTGTLTGSVWNDEKAKSFLTLNDAKQFAIEANA